MNFFPMLQQGDLWFITGSLVGVLITVSIAKALLSKFIKGGSLLFFSYLLSMIFVTVVGAYGLADGYDPQWKAAFFSYLPGHLIWLSFALLRAKVSMGSKVFSKESMKYSAVVFFVFLPGCFLVIFLAFGTGLTTTDSSKAYKAESSALLNLVKTVEDTNKGLPLKVNDEIRLLKVSLEGDKTLVQHYEISKSDFVTKGFREDVEKNGVGRMAEYYCLDSAPMLKKLEVTVIHRYADQGDNFLTQTVLDTVKCTQVVLGLFASEIQGQLPIQADELTTLINVEAKNDRDFIYTFSVPSKSYESPDVAQNMSVNIPKNMKEYFCHGEGLDFKKINAKVAWRYLDENENPLTEYSLDTAKCDL